MEAKHPVLMSKEGLDDLIKKMDALESAWVQAPIEIQREEDVKKWR